METLTKKERSVELNTLKRALIDFKPLVIDDKFIIYKTDGLIHYIFDYYGFFMVIKNSDFLNIEKFIDEDEFIELCYSEIRSIVDLKKSEITNIVYDSEEYCIETLISEESTRYRIKKKKDNDDMFKNIVTMTSEYNLSNNFTEVSYDSNNQLLLTEDNKHYPYKITFSDDINFKLKIDESNSRYYMRPLNNGTFLQVVTISDFKEVYKPQTMLFVFNYLNNKEV